MASATAPDGAGSIGQRQRPLAAACLLFLLSFAPQTQAEPVAVEGSCRAPTGDWIALRTPEPTAFALVDWLDVVRHVRSELALRQVDLCSSATKGRPIARFTLSSGGPGSVRIELSTVEPEQPLAERSLELAPVPVDARLLAIAVAADELLAANWSELTRRANEARAPKPPAAATPKAPEHEPSVEVGPVFVYEHFAGGQALLGVDLRGGVRLVQRLEVTARLGLRQGLPEQADHGSVHATALVGGLGLRVELAETARLKLELLGRGDALRLSVSAYPAPGATAKDAQALAVVLVGGLGVRVALSRSLGLGVEATAGGAARPVHLTDTGRRVGGASGLALGLAGGVLAAF